MFYYPIFSVCPESPGSKQDPPLRQMVLNYLLLLGSLPLQPQPLKVHYCHL